MKSNKLCCRIFPVVLLLISTIIALGIWYFDDGILSFSFLSNKKEIFNFLGTALFIGVLPIGIFYGLNENEKYQSRARLLSLFGFLPAIAVFLFIVF